MHIWIGPPPSSAAVNVSSTEVLPVTSGLPALIVTVPVGGSFTAVTEMLTVAMLLSALPSLALKVKLSGPCNPPSVDRSGPEACR